MALPDKFSEAQHLKSVLLKVHNQNVREEFKDLGDEDWDPDINIPRGSLRHACTIKNNDSLIVIICRLFLYYFDLRQAQDLQQPVYGIPIYTFDSARQYKPQIMLYFSEDKEDIDPEYNRIDGVIRVRLMNQSATTLTMAEANQYAQRVKTAFATGSGYIWKKGKYMATYVEKEKGYQLQLLVRNKQEGKDLVNKVLDIQQHTPDWQYFKYSESEEPMTAFPTNPGTKVILGKTRKKARRRPIADVRFRYSVLQIENTGKPLCLVDTTARFLNPLIG